MGAMEKMTVTESELELELLEARDKIASMSAELKRAAAALNDAEKIRQSYEAMSDHINEVFNAIKDLYYTAYWYPDRPVPNPENKWMKLRDLVGLEPGESFKLLGPAQDPYEPARQRIDYLRNAHLAIVLSTPEKAQQIARNTLTKDGFIKDLLNKYE